MQSFVPAVYNGKTNQCHNGDVYSFYFKNIPNLLWCGLDLALTFELSALLKF
jgi:hypothetical protein